eukprot:CCRYP_006467-RB/>CCRYP_006467-RB protein AED:0.02 eAED:0.02 QI:225/1/1/1/0.66/0.5/4/29/1413
MAPDLINSNNRDGSSQPSPLDDISLSLSWSSKSSVHDDLTQLLGNICEDGSAPASQELLHDLAREQWKTESEASSSDHAHNLARESNVGCVQPQACSIKAQEATHVLVVPLMKWNETEASKIRHTDPQCQRELQQASMMRKITIGYGIGKLLQHVSRQQEPPISNYSWSQLESLCSIENFAVESINEVPSSEPGLEVRGVHMITPFLSVQIDTNCSPSSCSFEHDKKLTGRNVVATIISTSASVCVNALAQGTSDCDCMLCHLLGVLLHYLFSGSRSGQVKRHSHPKEERDYDPTGNEVVEVDDGLAMKKKSVDFFRFDDKRDSYNGRLNSGKDSYPLLRGADFSQATSVASHLNVQNDLGTSCASYINVRLSPLKELGYPASLSDMVTNLVDCGLGLSRHEDSYPSLDVAINDMQILLQEPQIFLLAGSPPATNAFKCSERLYGRSNEIASLTNAYCRVASSGIGESIFVGGFSGCGKSRLVHSIFESVNIAGGYAVTQKFDEMQSSSPLTVVLSAFNQLCNLVAQSSSETCLIQIYEKLASAIGTPNLTFLTHILPNAIDLLPSYVTLPYLNSQAGINFNRLCFTIQHLMRVLSSPSRTVLLFLDDLQWADAMSLKLVQSVISDMREFNCMLFVGGFRENDVEPGHVLFEFFAALSASEVVSSIIHLNGISPNHVNSMISDTLGILPRLCKSLSDVVFRKTNGNPFFTLEFLRSLIARDVVQYSLRDKCWKWNLNQIKAENITDNVLHLLTKKLSHLSDAHQAALKVVSCFGSIISIDIVRKLSSTSKYNTLQRTLDDTLVKEGLMDFDVTSYRFVHDKVREAAYGLIVDKEQYHFDLGIALQQVGGDILAAATQINRGLPLFAQDDSRRITIVNLNYQAGLQPMNCCDFTAAYSYLTTAFSLLPNDSWSAHYDLTLKCHFQLAKAAYGCGHAKRAQQICENIIECAKCLEDTLETYSLLVSTICLAHKDLPVAFKTCRKVLNSLGEDIPDDIVDTYSTVKKVKMLFQNMSSDDLLDMVEEKSSRNISIMEFYNHLVTVSFQLQPRRVCQYYNARWASFCLTNRVACKYTPGAFVSFASMLSRDLDEDATLACRISKAGMSMLSRNDSAMIQQLPVVYSIHFMMVGSLTEPIQSAVTMVRHAYEIGMQTGNLSQAAFSLAIMMARSLYAGTNLLNLRNDLEVHLKSAKQHSQLILLANLQMMHEVVSRLIGDDEAKSFPSLKEIPPTDEDVQFTLEMFSSFYLGHAERVHYKSKLWERLEDSEKRKVPIRFIYTAFFSGIASFRLYSYGRKDSQTHTKNLTKSLSILEKASEFSEWNYKNKFLLLKAAHLSITDNNFNAENEFGAAILASRASKFVHEEGLACELAAMYQVTRGNNTSALSLFCQAKSCYKTWGSRVKEIHIASLIDSIHE